MSTDNPGIVVGIFKEVTCAEDAIEELKSMGFNDAQIAHAAQRNNEKMRHIRETLERTGISEEEVDYYTSEFEAGRSVLLIRHEGRRIEAVSILFLNGTRSHKYLDVGSHSADSPTPATGESDKQGETSQSSSLDNQLEKPTQPDAVATEQDEIESVRRLLKSAGLDHLL